LSGQVHQGISIFVEFFKTILPIKKAGLHHESPYLLSGLTMRSYKTIPAIHDVVYRFLTNLSLLSAIKRALNQGPFLFLVSLPQIDLILTRAKFFQYFSHL